jgi:quercetin dioxygenase-like cupin family protein
MSDLANSQTAALSTDDFHRPKPDTAARSFSLRPVSDPDTIPTLDTRYFSLKGDAMQFTALLKGASLLLACGYVGMRSPVPQIASAASGPTPLILEESEGERRALRGWPGHPNPGETFVLKVDPKNGGSSHLVFMTASLAPGGEIVAHRHPNADEILFFETGTTKVQLGDSVRVVHAGATVFIPAGTWISAVNIGKDNIRAYAVFSAPGFEEYMRDVSVREGEKNVPLSLSEDEAIAKKHLHDVIYKEP